MLLLTPGKVRPPWWKEPRNPVCIPSETWWQLSPHTRRSFNPGSQISAGDLLSDVDGPDSWQIFTSFVGNFQINLENIHRQLKKHVSNHKRKKNKRSIFKMPSLCMYKKLNLCMSAFPERSAVPPIWNIIYSNDLFHLGRICSSTT